MKRLLAVLLSVSILMTGMLIAPASVSAEDTDPYAITVPDSWELLAEESFIKQPVDNGDGTVTEDFGLAEYESSMYTAVDIWDGTDADQKELAKDYAFIDANGLNLSMPKSISKKNTAEFTLTTPMDFSQEADYYIMYDVKPHGRAVGSTTLRLYNSTISTRMFNSSYTANNSPITISDTLYQSTNNSNVYSDQSKDFYYDDQTGKWNKVLLQFSPRGNGIVLMRERWFDITNEGKELPSLNPLYWNTTLYVDLKTEVEAGNMSYIMDTLYLANNHNSGSTNTAVYKNFKIYKAPAVSCYTTPTKKADESELKINYYTGDAVISTNNYKYTMTMDTPANLVSQGWYDYTDADSPVLLAEGATIDVPASMKGRILKAVTTVDENGSNVTYYPFSGIVHDIVEFNANSNKTLENTSPITAKLTYYKTNADGSVATSTTATKTNSETAARTYTDWTNATRLEFTGSFIVNANVSEEDGLIALVGAWYAEDGTLKQVFKPTPDSKTYQTGPGRISGYTSKTIQNFQLKLVQGANFDFSQIESGDYFKIFLWKTTKTPEAVDKKYYYNFEQMIPVSYNADRSLDTLGTVDVSGPAATVPYPETAE